MYLCPDCERTLKHANQWHHCAKVSIPDLFEGKDPELEYIADQILAQVSEWDSVIVSATKNCLVFVHNQTFLVIRPMQKVLDIKFYSEKPVEGSLIFKSAPAGKRFENHVRLGKGHTLNDVLFRLIRHSYQLL